MLKKILLPIAILFVFPSFLSGQGMWLPIDLINQEFNMISKGMKMSASDIYSANSGSLKDAIVHFGGFCTGEIISSKGLVLTNHHCGYGAIQKHSSVENDYLKHGFWAASMEDEKPNEGLYVDFIISIEDVSDKILPLVLNGLSEKQAIDSVLKSNPISGKSIGVKIKSIYYGNQFIQIVSQRFSDVRLVELYVNNKSLGIFKLKGIPAAPRGVPKINVTFQLDVDGLLAVSAREEQSGQEQSIKIAGASTLAREEVSKMIKEAEENASKDKSRKAIINITYEFDNLFAKSETFINKNSDLDSDAFNYFKELLVSIKNEYKVHNLESISIKYFDKLKYSYCIIVIDFFKSELQKTTINTSSKASPGKGVVIDVTDD